MKKSFLFIAIIILTVCPSFAGQFQEKYENNNSKINDFLNSIPPSLNLMIKEDMNAFNNGGGSLYGVCLKLLEDDKNKTVNLKYLKILIQRWEDGYRNNSYSYIDIDDSDFAKLDENTKLFIGLYNNLYKKDNTDITTSHMENIDLKRKSFYENKNNMKQNKEFYEDLINKQKLYDDYLNNPRSDVDKTQDIIKNIKELSKEIYDYSYSYEEKKYNDWAKKNNKKFIRGALEQVVYYSTYQPIQNALYIHNPQGHFYLRVVQSVPGGVILTGDPSIKVNTNFIFLETSKQFADNTIITEPLVVEYKGLYKYTTVLGAQKTIHKFYRLGAKEQQDNFNIPGQQFYFFVPKIIDTVNKQNNKKYIDNIRNNTDSQNEILSYENSIDNEYKVNFKNYIKELQKRVYINWDPPKGSEKQVILLLKISKEGKLINVVVERSSNMPAFDNAAINAVKLTAPFRPLPTEYKKDYVNIQLVFKLLNN